MSLGHSCVWGCSAPPSEPHQNKWESPGTFSPGRCAPLAASSHTANVGPDRHEHPGLILPDFASVLLLLSPDRVSPVRYLQDLQCPCREPPLQAFKASLAEASLILIKDLITQRSESLDSFSIRTASCLFPRKKNTFQKPKQPLPWQLTPIILLPLSSGTPTPSLKSKCLFFLTFLWLPHQDPASVSPHTLALGPPC